MDRKSAQSFLQERLRIDAEEAAHQQRLAEHQPEAEESPETPRQRYEALNARLNSLPLVTSGAHKENDSLWVDLDDAMALVICGQVSAAFERSDPPHYSEISAYWEYKKPTGERFIPRRYFHVESVKSYQTDPDMLPHSRGIDDSEPTPDEVDRKLSLLEQSLTVAEDALAAQQAAGAE